MFDLVDPIPTIEIGLWLFMVIPSAVFTFVRFPQFGTAQVALQMLAMGMFLGLAVLHAGGYEVSSESTTTLYDQKGKVIGTNVDHIVLIAGGETYSWLAFVFVGFAIFNITSLFREKVFNF